MKMNVLYKVAEERTNELSQNKGGNENNEEHSGK
jgi:hypothetical protein